MKKRLAFVLSGGGSRGALQVGALQALIEAGIYPDLLVGASVGAINATFLALGGVNLNTIDTLIKIWYEAAAADLLPANYLWLSLRAFFNRPDTYSMGRMREFIISHGLQPDLRFDAIQGVQLIIVSTDLVTGEVVCFGCDPRQTILDGVLASTALPPWIMPIKMDGRVLIDGGVVSSLPIESAIQYGATDIIALDLFEPREVADDERGFGSFLENLMLAVQVRQIELEKALAKAYGIKLHYIRLHGNGPVPLWDFTRTKELIECGRELTQKEIEIWRTEPRPSRWDWLRRILSYKQTSGF